MDLSFDLDHPMTPIVRERPAGRQPTMRDVAARAGVSLSTVSRVVNGDATVRRVLAAGVREAIDELGYRRDLTASSLRRADRASTLIGLVFDDIGNPFFSSLHRGVEQVARKRGVLTLAGSSDDEPARQRELAEAFGARHVDGMIIAPVGEDHTYLERERRARVALVFVDRPATSLDVDVVMADNAGGAQRGVEHLLSGGHRRIGYLGDRQHIASSRERLHGYRVALAAAGIPFDSGLVRLDVRGTSIAAGEVEALLSRPEAPTALFTAQNLITIGAVHALKRLGLEQVIALVGFDDIDLADAVDPALTVVAQDPFAIGRGAAELLFARIDGDRAPARRVFEPTRLIVRGSGEIRPAG
jgi:LacI family transcriptional regulator